jgi:hypothetical protein
VCVTDKFDFTSLSFSQDDNDRKALETVGNVRLPATSHAFM